MRVYMSGGTTGASRPTLYTAWDREAGAILMARALYMQGIQPGDVVINAWAYSTHNGAHAMDEALYRWLNCVVLTTGTGNVTPTRKQIELAVQYEAKAILTTGDYLLHLADTAREMGLDPATDLQLTALPNIGDKERLTSTFGLPVYDSYGFHEVQWVAIECPAGGGMHIFEDAFVVQIVDVETGRAGPRRRAGRDLHHRDLQDRKSTVPLQHHGPLHPSPARPVRVRELAPQDGAVRRARRQHGQAPRRQHLARSTRRDRHRPSTASPTTTSSAPPVTATATR